MNEQVVPSYINKNYIREQEKVIYRLDDYGKRYYYEFNEDGSPIFFKSVTTKISECVPLDKNIIEWACNFINYDEYIKELNRRADYGTLIHILLEYIVLRGDLEISYIEELAQEFVEENKLDVNVQKELTRIIKTLIGFNYWYSEYNIDPIAIEIILSSKNIMLAGSLDLVAYATIKGEKKLGLIDYKTSKQTYTSHIIQLHIYRKLWNESYPENPIEFIANWLPNDFKNLNSKTGKPYKFKIHKEDDQMNMYVDQIINMINPFETSKGGQIIKEYSGLINTGLTLEEIRKFETEYTLEEKIKIEN